MAAELYHHLLATFYYSWKVPARVHSPIEARFFSDAINKSGCCKLADEHTFSDVNPSSLKTPATLNSASPDFTAGSNDQNILRFKQIPSFSLSPPGASIANSPQITPTAFIRNPFLDWKRRNCCSIFASLLHRK